MIVLTGRIERIEKIAPLSRAVLQMTMNDWGYDNNTGSVKVQIDIK